MSKISVIEGRARRRLVFQGKLITTWAGELRTACRKARADLCGRELVIDMRDLTAISQEGENLLIELMNEGVKFHGRGAFTQQVLKQVAGRTNTNIHEAKK